MSQGQIQPLTDAFRMRLGDAVIQFAALEHTLGAAIGRLLEAKGGDVVTSVMPFSMKLHAYQALARIAAIRDKARTKEVDALCDKLNKTDAERNKYVHSLWTLSEEADTAFRLTAKLQTVRISKITTSQILKFAAETKALAHELGVQADALLSRSD